MINKRIIKWFVWISLIAGNYQLGLAQSNAPLIDFYNNPSSIALNWVDSVFDSMSLEARIGQLFMAAAYSNRGVEHQNEILNLIREHHIGGLVFFQGGPERQMELTNLYQSTSNIPLLMAIDAEWGLGMRLDSTVSLPYQMALGACKDDRQIYEMGKLLGENLKRMGIHMNLAPVADINNNPENPVISYRSFGENRENVMHKSIAFMKGMQDIGILATAKHFPGHGDTAIDSHLGLPVIAHNRKRLDSIELYPFSKMIEAGISGVMIAHMNIPALDNTANLPATLSAPIVNDLLREKLSFKGLVVTDAMNMKGVTKYFPTGEAEIRALLAGNDLIEFSPDIPKAMEAVKEAVGQGRIHQDLIDQKCKKILLAKYWLGLSQLKPLSTRRLIKDLNNPEIDLINRKLIGSSLTVLNNIGNILPVKDPEAKKIASVSIGVNAVTPFQNRLSDYSVVHHYTLPLMANELEISQLKEQLRPYDLLIIGLHQVRRRPTNNDAYPLEIKQLLNELPVGKEIILTVFRNPYTLGKFENVAHYNGLIMSYFESDLSQDLSAQLIFGGIGASGRLPVTINETFNSGDGIDTAPLGRFEYSQPEAVGMDSEILTSGIDSLINLALESKAIPGAQVLVAKEGKVIFHKAYGYQSHFDTVKVRLTDLYDLASITKVTSALPIIMKLVDEGKIDLDAPIAQYIPLLKNSAKANLTVRSILAHQARLKPWIPYWENTIKNGTAGFKAKTFRTDSSKNYPIKVVDNLYLHRNYRKKIFKAIKASPLEIEAKYKYSGLIFYLFPTMIENITGSKFEDYLYQNFYDPLGATTLKYKPDRFYSLDQIVPTEYDLDFRRVMLHGTVHDEGAAMMDGMSANAGLFSNANDLAKLFQMYLNKGKFGGKEYLTLKTVNDFTSYQFPENDNRRGLGFDKPSLMYVPNGNAAKDASNESFGHTGYTGTRVWADPKHQLVYIFLANRVHPSRTNNKLYKLNTRTDIEQVIYDAIK